MAYWSFSDVFEEQGVVKTPFYGGFGLMAAGGLPKPAFNAFALLHHLGEQRFVNDPEGTLLTRRADGTLALALWNYADVNATAPVRKVTLKLVHSAARSAHVQMMDLERGNVLVAYEKMGSPRYPTEAQLAQLRTAAALGAPEKHAIGAGGTLSLDIPAHGLVIVTVAEKAAGK
jgi:xylan 1,4-beta-xylosidase